jgi:hypothetical protein
MESEDEAMGIPIDPHRKTIRDLHILIQSYQQQRLLIFLLMDGNQDDLRVFQQQDIPNKVCTPLGFNYDKNIDGSIATLIESCNLINIHKLKHGYVPATHNAGSLQMTLASSSLQLLNVSTYAALLTSMPSSRAITESSSLTLIFSSFSASRSKALKGLLNFNLSYMTLA